MYKFHDKPVAWIAYKKFIKIYIVAYGQNQMAYY